MGPLAVQRSFRRDLAYARGLPVGSKPAVRPAAGEVAGRRPHVRFPKFESYEAAFVEPVGPCLDRWSRLVSSISAMMRCLQFHGIDELVVGAIFVPIEDNCSRSLPRLP